MAAIPSTEPGTVVIRYRNRAGALVTVTRLEPRENRFERFGAECAACLDAMKWHLRLSDTLTDGRNWASAHAAECHALPQPDEQD